jgi:branched-subunit amino acid transport protein
VSDSLFVLAALMWVATYPWRIGPLVLPVFDRLPPLALAYLRLVGPAVLAALAAVAVLVSDEQSGYQLHLGIDAAAVLLCVGLVAWRRNVLLGLVAAVGLVAAAHAVGVS